MPNDVNSLSSSRFSSRLKIRQIGLILILLTMSACQTSKLSTNWPEDLPPLKIFVDAHKRQTKNGTNTASLETHLTWIKRFYKGSILYPIGWNDMIENVAESFPPEEKADAIYVEQKLAELGLKICIEWAQSNDKRKINSSNIAVWGSALRKSVESKEQVKFIKIVEPDVNALLSGQLTAKEITLDRYYPPENYDNF